MPNRNVNETANPLETTEHDLPALYTSPEPPPPNLQVDGEAAESVISEKRIGERIKSKLQIESDQDSLEFLQTLLMDYNYYSTR